MKDARTTPPSWALVDSLTEARRQCEAYIEKLESDLVDSDMKKRHDERVLAIFALSKLSEQNSASRLQVYDHLFERLQANLSENTHAKYTEIEISNLLREIAIKYGL
jgi:hypothetical protein